MYTAKTLAATSIILKTHMKDELVQGAEGFNWALIVASLCTWGECNAL
jgi:hypothetical protein